MGVGRELVVSFVKGDEASRLFTMTAAPPKRWLVYTKCLWIEKAVWTGGRVIVVLGSGGWLMILKTVDAGVILGLMVM